MLEAIQEHAAEHKAIRAKVRELSEEFGADGLMSRGQEVKGFIFRDPAKVPAGWCHAAGEDTYRPANRGKGREIMERLQALQVPTAITLQEKLDCNPMHFMRGLRVEFMGFEKLGDVWVLSVPAISPDESDVEGVDSQWSPPDDGCQVLSMAAYYYLKAGAIDAAEAGKEGASA